VKVKDLLRELQAADPEADIIYMMSDGCCSDYEYLDLRDASFEEYKYFNSKSELVKPKDMPHGMFEFRFHAPWFLGTCLTSGTAKRAAQEHIDRSYPEGHPLKTKPKDP
jgi:hypothetical protein